MAPQAVAAAVVATVVKVGANIVTGAVGAAILAGASSIFITTLAVSGLSMVLQKRPKLNPQGSMAGRSQMVKQPLISRKIVYGRQKVSGGIVYMKTTGKSEFLNIIVAIASNELNSIEKIFFNDDELTLDGSGNVTAPSQYVGKAQVLTGLGADDQQSNATIVLHTLGLNSSSGLNFDDRFQGIAYILSLIHI